MEDSHVGANDSMVINSPLEHQPGLSHVTGPASEANSLGTLQKGISSVLLVNWFRDLALLLPRSTNGRFVLRLGAVVDQEGGLLEGEGEGHGQ